MQQKNMCKRCGYGKLPAKAPLANPYVPFQPDDSVMYEPRKALIRGTLYQGLDLPFMGMTNKYEKPRTPMTDLQTLSFVLQELALYLDTHSDDQEALTLYRKFQQALNKATQDYELKYGPLTHSGGNSDKYGWIDDPWPWEYTKNREA